MLANIVEKWCLRGWYKNQKIPDLCGGAEQLRYDYAPSIVPRIVPAHWKLFLLRSIPRKATWPF
ncbi:hypothetical protein [Endozoicomonas sp. SCSIO W0465]|uniref:hypothetical protein n=1 Tax=Endozoicomonas sp. SCSIO W0465 TaxID=2918516 RepID=UPI002075F642|nr:hypothetical protein [Endozoicomonas sp. SCSIO W0465]USE35089.1 hypothetical protein MJO57_23710 [Endozoicomonas sp. SCSIO W0465]